MIPSSPEQQQRRAAKRVRFPSADLSHVEHIDVVSQEYRQEYWYTPAEYSVIEREIKQTVRRLRKRVAAEMKQESELVSCSNSSPSKRHRHVLDTTKYCDRGLEDFVHHYETKQLKTTIAKVILTEQEIQRARGVHDPDALMQVSMACTQLSRQQAISLAEQDAKDVQRICGRGQQQTADFVLPNDDAGQFLFSKDMTSICDDITKSSSMMMTKDNEPIMRPPLTLLSICDQCDAPPALIRTEVVPMSG